MKKDSIKWWYPIKNEYDELDWLCDHVGDAQEVMEAMWKRLCELDKNLSAEGYRYDE